MSFSNPNQDSQRSFNNADSFAMAFDEAWKKVNLKNEIKECTQDQKLNLVLEEIKEHPFLKDSPQRAVETALFRLRLLKLP